MAKKKTVTHLIRKNLAQWNLSVLTVFSVTGFSQVDVGNVNVGLGCLVFAEQVCKDLNFTLSMPTKVRHDGSNL